MDQHYICITPDQGIVFPSVTYMRNLISKAAMKQGNSKMAVVINCMHVSHTDFTAAESFHAMIEDFKSRGQPVYWFATNTNVIRTLKSVTGMGVYFFEKSFQSLVLCVVFKILKLPQNLSFKLGYFQKN